MAKTYLPQQLIVEGSLSGNRPQWLAEGRRFGQERFGDDQNSHDAQARRLHQQIALYQERATAALESNTIEFWDFLQARGSLKMGKAAGPDGVPAEVWKALPIQLTWMIWQLFQKRASFNSGNEQSDYWRLLEFVGIPKSKAVTHLEQFRWIAKLSNMLKWYMLTLRPSLRGQIRATAVHTYGFKRGFRTSDITALMQQMIFNASSWGHNLYVSIQDVKFAFDSMDHDVLTQSLLHMGASHGMVGLLLQELHGLRGRFAIPGAGDTEFFNYERGGKQGGVETPDCWNAI
eukprot:6762694-Pyramimonas_sp.AAC.1